MSVDNLKSVISKKGGLAKNNRFQVLFTPPTQALVGISIENVVGNLITGKSNGIKQFVNDPRDISILCEQVTLPSRSLSTIDYVSDRQSNKFPYTSIDGDVTMHFIVTNDYYAKTLFETWMSSIVDTEGYQLGYKNDYSTDIVIQQLNQQNIPIYSVRLEGAFPVTVNAVSLDSNAENTIQKMSVTLSYENFVTEDIVDTIKSTAGVVGATLGI